MGEDVKPGIDEEAAQQRFKEEMQAAMDYLESERSENGCVTFGQGDKKVVMLPVPVVQSTPAAQPNIRPATTWTTYVFLTNSGVKGIQYTVSGEAIDRVGDEAFGFERVLKKTIDTVQAMGGTDSNTELGYNPKDTVFGLHGEQEAETLRVTGLGAFSSGSSQGGSLINAPEMLSKALEASKAEIQAKKEINKWRRAQEASLDAVRSITPPKSTP